MSISRKLAVVVIACLAAAGVSSGAETLEWNPAVTNPPTGGDGVWGADENWWDDFNQRNFSWIPGKSASFGAPAGVVTALLNFTSVQDISFSATGYRLVGTRLVACGGNVDTPANITATIDFPFATVFRKTGAGTLVLGGASQSGSVLRAGTTLVNASNSGASGEGPLGRLGCTLNNAADAELRLLTNGAFTVTNWLTVENSPGTVVVGGQTADLSIFANTIGLAKGVTLTAAKVGNNIGRVEFRGRISGTGSVLKTGLGGVELTSAVGNDYSEDTDILQGFMVIRNETGFATGNGITSVHDGTTLFAANASTKLISVLGGATLAITKPTATGEADVPAKLDATDLSLRADARLLVVLGNPADGPGVGFSKITVSGTADLRAGVADLVLKLTRAPAVGDVFPFMRAGTLRGTFRDPDGDSTVVGNFGGVNYTFQITYPGARDAAGEGMVELSYVPAPSAAIPLASVALGFGRRRRSARNN